MQVSYTRDMPSSYPALSSTYFLVQQYDHCLSPLGASLHRMRHLQVMLATHGLSPPTTHYPHSRLLLLPCLFSPPFTFLPPIYNVSPSFSSYFLHLRFPIHRYSNQHVVKRLPTRDFDFYFEFIRHPRPHHPHRPHHHHRRRHQDQGGG